MRGTPHDSAQRAHARVNDVRIRLTGTVADPLLNDLEFAERELREVVADTAGVVFETDSMLDLSSGRVGIALCGSEAAALNDLLRDYFELLKTRDPHVWEGQSSGEILLDLLQDAHKMSVEDATAFMLKLGFDT